MDSSNPGSTNTRLIAGRIIISIRIKIRNTPLLFFIVNFKSSYYFDGVIRFQAILSFT
jgi:hypothetical protein